MPMSQDDLILQHLQQVGTITGVEASALYRARSLTSNISRLRTRGYIIHSERKLDQTNQRYVRYTYKKSENKGVE